MESEVRNIFMSTEQRPKTQEPNLSAFKTYVIFLHGKAAIREASMPSERDTDAHDTKGFAESRRVLYAAIHAVGTKLYKSGKKGERKKKKVKIKRKDCTHIPALIDLRIKEVCQPHVLHPVQNLFSLFLRAEQRSLRAYRHRPSRLP
jgi:hypothetical protein